MPQFRHMSQICCAYLQNEPLQFIGMPKNLNSLFKYASNKYSPIKTMFLCLAVSETQCIIYRLELHNSQASRKKLKK